MASGNYGFPHDLALSIAIGAITDFLMNHDTTIYLVLFGNEAFGLATSLFDDLKSYVDDYYVAETKKKEYGFGPSYHRRRYESNMPSEWVDDFDGDDTLLCALDRVFDDATVYKLRGRSYRGKRLKTVTLEVTAGAETT